MDELTASARKWALRSPCEVSLSLAYKHKDGILTCKTREKNQAKKCRTQLASELKLFLALQTDVINMIESDRA